jgi:hypothetical protein
MMETVEAALAHYDDCRALLDDARRVAGPDSAEYIRAEQAKRIALVVLDAALAARRASGGAQQAGARDERSDHGCDTLDSGDGLGPGHGSGA